MKKFLFVNLLNCLLLSCSAQQGVSSSLTENKVNVSLDSLNLDGVTSSSLYGYKFTCYTASYKLENDHSLSLIYVKDSSEIIDINVSSGLVNKQIISGKNPVVSSTLSVNKAGQFYTVLNQFSELYTYSQFSKQEEPVLIDSLPSFIKNSLVVSGNMGFNLKTPYINDSSILIHVVDFGTKKNKIIYASVNLISKKLKFYNFPLMKELYKNNHPMRNTIKLESKGDTLFVGYQFSEKVDMFSLSRNNYIGTVSLRSKFQTGAVAKLKDKKINFEKERYAIESDYYDVITYNPYKKCYYRLYYHSLPRLNENNEYTITKDKVLSLAIFDEDFNWIGEQIVDEKYFWSGIVPHPLGALSLWGWSNGKNCKLSIVKHE